MDGKSCRREIRSRTVVVNHRRTKTCIGCAVPAKNSLRETRVGKQMVVVRQSEAKTFHDEDIRLKKLKCDRSTGKVGRTDVDLVSVRSKRGAAAVVGDGIAIIIQVQLSTVQ